MSYKYILTSIPRAGVFQVILNRPKALNALKNELITEVIDAIAEADAKVNEFGAVVLTGNNKAFAAGADIKQMENVSHEQALKTNMLSNWEQISNFQIPIIAAVEGYALGGGCELAMTADIIYASKKALFGQPEVKLGVTPGCGGTQRLIRAIGKSRAMEYVLTGDTFTGVQAEQWGLVSKTFEPGEVLENALDLAEKLAQGPPLAIRSNKKALNIAYEANLSAGLRFERSIFQGLFGTDEQREGMTAFVEKRPADWKKGSKL